MTSETVHENNKQVFASSKALTIKVSIPEGNHFYINKGNGYGSSYGFLGLSYGIEYFFMDNHSLDIKVGVALDKPNPIPNHGTEPDPTEKSHETAFNFIALQKGQEWKNFHTSFGVQLSECYYSKSDPLVLPDTIITTNLNPIQQQLGAAFSGYLKTKKALSLGVNYFPSFIVLDPGHIKFHYTHLIMAEVIFRIKTRIR